MNNFHFAKFWLEIPECLWHGLPLTTNKLATEISNICPHEAIRKFVRFNLYLSLKLCIWDLEKTCNGHIKYTTNRSSNIQNNQPTKVKAVNFITIDYTTEGKGKNVVKMQKKW